MFVSLCSNPSDAFKSVTVLAHVLITVISLLLLLFQAYTNSRLTVMCISTEAKIWILQKGFLILSLGKTHHMQHKVYL